MSFNDFARANRRTDTTLIKVPLKKGKFRAIFFRNKFDTGIDGPTKVEFTGKIRDLKNFMIYHMNPRFLIGDTSDGQKEVYTLLQSGANGTFFFFFLFFFVTSVCHKL